MIGGLLATAVERAGSITNLAVIAGRPRTTISDWLNGSISDSMIGLWRIIEFVDQATAGTAGTGNVELASENQELRNKVVFYERIIQSLTDKTPGVSGAQRGSPQEIVTDPVPGLDESARVVDNLKQLETVVEQQRRRKTGGSRRG